MRQAHRVEVVRAAEAALMARVPEGTLMQRAATGLACVCSRLLAEQRAGVYGARIAVLVGSGDNGGDALYAAARLARRGAHVDALLLRPDRAHSGGLAALRDAHGTVHAVHEFTAAHRVSLQRADLVLDGVIGIGGRGGLREAAADAARSLDEIRGLVVAVDVPSGVDSSTGEVAGVAISADVTVTFGTYKPGLLIDPGAEHAGVVELIDIGLTQLPDSPDVAALTTRDVAALLPAVARETDKYRRGVVGIVCGSNRYTGAAVLATGSALRSGAGAVRYAGPTRVADLVRASWPDALISEGSPADAGRVQAWVVGSGIDTDEQAERRLLAALEQDLPTLLDADALTLLARTGPDLLADRHSPVVITPHAGEASRLLGDDRADIEANRLDAVRRLADHYGVITLLKGSTTLVAEPGGGTVRVNSTGTPALATAGSGDVLSGLTGGLLATGMSGVDAASVGAWLHGLAGRIASSGRRSGDTVGQHPIAAQDVLRALPDAWASVVAPL